MNVMLDAVVREKIARWKEFESQLPEQVSVPSLRCLAGNWGESLDTVTSRRLAKIASGATEAPMFLILYGPPGVGKTSLAAALSKNLFVKQDYGSLQYVTGPDLLWQLSFGNTDGAQPVKRYVNSDILLLDDIGIADANITPTRREGMWNIVNSRWGRGHKALTIIITNADVAPGAAGKGSALSEIFGESARDRITDEALIVKFTGKSKRRNSRA